MWIFWALPPCYSHADKRQVAFMAPKKMGSAGRRLVLPPAAEVVRFLTHRRVQHGSMAAWQEGSSLAALAAWRLAVSWSFIHDAAIAINFGILTFTLFVWGLSAANAANTSRIPFFFIPGMLAPDKTFCILNLHWNFLTLRDLFLFILYMYIVCLQNFESRSFNYT